ncbi:MAG: rod shape-determining protein MreC [Actinomycetia bacterium]|nr:rod shape-determining protein MreC [Actinomycetes bacterium]
MALSPTPRVRTPSATLVLIACCLLSVIAMTVWVREEPDGFLHRFRDGFSVFTAPLQTAGSTLTTPLRALGRLMGTNNLSAEDIAALQEENTSLRSQIIELQEYKTEADNLSALLGLSDAYGLESTGARVIDRSPNDWNRTITINKGTNAGLRPGMPVVSVNGLIGQIDSAGPTSSVVRLITDQASGVAVFLQGSRTEGLMTGSPDGTLYLRYIGLDVDVQPGARIVTSGSGGVYPKGIPVGTVQSVSFLPADVYQTIVIQPLGQAPSYEEVFVITGSESEIKPLTGSDTTGGSGSGGTNQGTSTTGSQP